jgi:ribulose-5-phosphate 4-epimerase/fuculose-1-phosphate aldolase
MNEASTARDLVDANRILYDAGVVDAFGHVSVRHSQRDDRFLLSASVAPAMVDESDILEFDLDGRPSSDDGRRLYAERFIHSEIYRARPDVHAVVHSHSPAVLPFCITRAQPLRPVCHMSGFLGGCAQWFEMREFAGLGSDLLVKNRELGASLARCLGNHAVVLMRGHGCTVVAPSLKVAVYRAIYTELNAKVQMSAQQMGPITFLSPEEADATAAANEGQVDRAWQLWKAQAATNPFQRRQA